MNDDLRKRCKMLKAIDGVSYKEIASYIEITQNSFYCWLKGYYELSRQKTRKLEEVIDLLKGV